MISAERFSDIILQDYHGVLDIPFAPEPLTYPPIELIPNPDKKSEKEGAIRGFLKRFREPFGETLQLRAPERPTALLQLAAPKSEITGYLAAPVIAGLLSAPRTEVVRKNPGTYIPLAEVAIIKKDMATDGTETIEAPTAAKTELSPAPIPTPTELRKQEEHETRGSAGLAPQTEKKGLFSRFKTKAVLIAAAVGIAVGTMATGVAAKIWGGSNNAETPQPQNALTKTVPTSETSQGVFDKATQPVVPTTVAEQPKPTPTLAPGIGGANPLPTFESGSPKAAINPLVEQFNAGKDLSNADKNQITEAFTSSPYKQTNEGIFYKGQDQDKEIRIPSVDGLKAEIRGDKVVYVDQKGEVVGVFHAETYEIKPEGQFQTGLLVLKPEVTNRLLQAQRSNNNAVIAVPFDPTTATADRTLIIQNTETRSGSKQVTFQVPAGARLTNSTDEKTTKTIINPQSWGGATVRLQANILGKYEAIITTADSLSRGTTNTEPGATIATISGRPFSNEVRTLLDRWTPQPAAKTNAYLDMKQGFTEADGSLPSLKVTTTNLLRIDETFVSTMSSDNKTN